MKVKEVDCERGYIDPCGFFTGTAAAATYGQSGLLNSAIRYQGKTYALWEWVDEDTIEISEIFQKGEEKC